jgi:hypothetical protein
MSDHTVRQPELSVAVITMDTLESTRQLMRYLQAQTARSRIELVIVCPSEEALALPAEIEGFDAVGPSARLTRCTPRASPRCHASAPVIATRKPAFGAGLAESLIAAHRGRGPRSGRS